MREIKESGLTKQAKTLTLTSVFAIHKLQQKSPKNKHGVNCRCKKVVELV